MFHASPHTRLIYGRFRLPPHAGEEQMLSNLATNKQLKVALDNFDIDRY